MTDTKSRILDGTLLQWLGETHGMDVGMLIESNSHAGADIVAAFQDLLGTYGDNPRRKWGIQSNGLCLVLAWTNELIQRLHYPADN